MNRKHKELAAKTAAKVIAQMKTTDANWICPWLPDQSQTPRSRESGKAYTGINWLILSLVRAENDWATGEFGTMRAWNRLGYRVRKGERSQHVIFYKSLTVPDRENADATITVPFMRSFSVFNADQIDGYSPVTIDTTTATNPETIADNVAAGCNAEVVHTDKVRAYFSPSKDHINMPLISQFAQGGGAAYASTLFHELGHWTGVKKRLNRTFGKRFGDDNYNAEELVAELSSAMLCALYNVSPPDSPRPDHAQYLKGFAERLQAKPETLFHAAAQAQKATTYIHKLVGVISDPESEITEPNTQQKGPTDGTFQDSK